MIAGACLRCRVCSMYVGSARRGQCNGATYHEMSRAMAVDLVGDVAGAATVLGHGHLAMARGLEGPDDVGILWVLAQLVGGQRGHGGCGYGRISTDAPVQSAVLFTARL